MLSSITNGIRRICCQVFKLSDGEESVNSSVKIQRRGKICKIEFMEIVSPPRFSCFVAGTIVVLPPLVGDRSKAFEGDLGVLQRL